MIKKSIFLFVTLAVLVACKKHRLRGNREALEGKWEWIFSIKSESSLTAGWSYQDTIFPYDVASSYSVEFKKNGKVHFLENGELVNKYRVVFQKFQEPMMSSLFVNNGTLYEFDIALNNRNENAMGGFVSSDSLRFYNRGFPFNNGSNTSTTLLTHTNYFKRVYE